MDATRKRENDWRMIAHELKLNEEIKKAKMPEKGLLLYIDCLTKHNFLCVIVFLSVGLVPSQIELKKCSLHPLRVGIVSSKIELNKRNLHLLSVGSASSQIESNKRSLHPLRVGLVPSQIELNKHSLHLLWVGSALS